MKVTKLMFPVYVLDEDVELVKETVRDALNLLHDIPAYHGAMTQEPQEFYRLDIDMREFFEEWE